ncbi:hypothetical protein BDN72DRAFT_870805 [Pluteus cervinus]|uniref:Uncharacterized protein n=1 Tax=Pluteus cervinus TaxID=181527 RepID=A0ACD3ATE8_9AGAR|nr:hypothetical protein BDN72DRAFT_870805 [Pluteus cervinus]
MADHSQYSSASSVPLIKSPSIRVPKPVILPPDIHPLPDNITDYFVYPFTLEPHVITLESSRRTTIAAHSARREAYIRSREDEKERRRREALRRIAPGFEPQGSVLVPTRPAQNPLPEPTPVRSVMDDLVDHLANLSSGGSPSGGSVGRA